jgi:hypothetical protein
LIDDLRTAGRLKPGKRTLLIGFGVGLSWAGCVWTETWAAKQAKTADATTSDVQHGNGKPADVQQGNGKPADAKRAVGAA